MRVNYNMEKQRNIRDYLDLSKYTGMEVEHGNNTDNRAPMNSASNLGHFNPHSSI